MAERLMGWVSNTNEPKRVNRYEILFTDDLRLTCKSANIPDINIDKQEIHRMHNLYKVAAAKVTYGDFTCSFYDFVDNKASAALDTWHKQVYNRDTSLMGFPADYKQNLTLLVYGPDHSVVESWLLVGAWPSDIKRSSTLDWTDNGKPIEVNVTFHIDEAKLILSSGV